jgi:hypothetical protein
VTDPDGHPVTLDASVGTISNNGDGTWNWRYVTSDGPDQSQTVTIGASDGHGGTNEITFELTVNNVAPTADAGSDQTFFRNDIVDVSGSWTDPAGPADEPYHWAWDLDGDGTPDSDGTATYGSVVAESTSFSEEGLYTLTFAVTDKDGASDSDSLTIEVLNRPPVCAAPIPSIDAIWPPNHEFVIVDVVGVTDPEGDAITISIDAIFQDEPVEGTGDGNFTPDAMGVGTSAALVRAERDGGGNGRVYHIYFTAEDGHGGTCSGEVLVSVPKSKGKTGVAVDDGPLFDSTVE